MRLIFALLALANCAYAVNIAGQEYVGVNTTAKNLGMASSITPDKKKVTYLGASQSAVFYLNQRSCVINGTRVWLNYPIAAKGPYLYVSKLDYNKTLLPLLKPRPLGKSLRLRHIVIDPGHGGRDTGARNTKLKAYEKMLTLDLAQRVKQELESLGYKVTLTRTSDKFIDLKDRPQISNALKADLFVSIHFNAASDYKIRGIETYAYTPANAPSSAREELSNGDKVVQNGNMNDTANLWLAYHIQKSLVETLKSPDRGVRRARFVVLEGLRCPGVLIEGGFLSSTSEGSRLASALYRQQMAHAIVSGIRSYHRQILEMR